MHWGKEWLTDSLWAQLGLTVKGEMGVSGLLTWLAKEPPGTHSCLGEKKGGWGEKVRDDDVMDIEKKMERISGGG